MRTLESGDGTVKTLYIDRDPETFQDIARHLQGKSSTRSRFSTLIDEAIMYLHVTVSITLDCLQMHSSIAVGSHKYIRTPS